MYIIVPNRARHVIINNAEVHYRYIQDKQLLWRSLVSLNRPSSPRRRAMACRGRAKRGGPEQRAICISLYLPNRARHIIIKMCLERGAQERKKASAQRKGSSHVATTRHHHHLGLAFLPLPPPPQQPVSPGRVSSCYSHVTSTSLIHLFNSSMHIYILHTL